MVLSKTQDLLEIKLILCFYSKIYYKWVAQVKTLTSSLIEAEEFISKFQDKKENK